MTVVLLPVQHAASRQEFLQKFTAAAVERTHHTVRYDPAYVRIAYPGGDAPAETGVCTDEVIRSYRAVGVDLQKKFMKICWPISTLIQANGAGTGRAPTLISIIAECQT